MIAFGFEVLGRNCSKEVSFHVGTMVDIPLR